jgi:antitoxin component of RelBE/YafQ-DinJ toxin-antitoxin module
MLSDMNIKRVDTEKKNKAIFVLKCKGKDLSTAVREMLDKYAKEYDEMQKNNS